VDDVRYIILPGDIRNDARLTLGHLKVAMVLGAYSKRQGWTDLTQSDVGEMAGLSRQTVCTLVGELVEWGWVARRKKDRKNQYVYRFIMDREEYCQLQPTVGGYCQPQPTEHCQPQLTGTVGSDPTFIKEDSSTYKDQLTSREGARATETAARPRLKVPRLVTASDDEWPRWLNWLSNDGKHRAREQFEVEGEMVVFQPYPSADADDPKLAPPEGSPKRAELMAKRVPQANTMAGAEA
jgi:DNA-binding MarR family transcriptional regulator